MFKAQLNDTMLERGLQRLPSTRNTDPELENTKKQLYESMTMDPAWQAAQQSPVQSPRALRAPSRVATDLTAHTDRLDRLSTDYSNKARTAKNAVNGSGDDTSASSESEASSTNKGRRSKR